MLRWCTRCCIVPVVTLLLWPLYCCTGCGSESDIGGEHGYGDQGVYQMDAMMKAEHLVPTPLSATVPWSVSNSQRNTATAQQFLQQSV